MTTAASTELQLPLPEWRAEILARLADGARFGGIYTTHRGDGAHVRVLLITRTNVESLSAQLKADAGGSCPTRR